MKILVVGYGSIGQRHVRNLQQLVPDVQITIWRQHTTVAEQVASDTLKFVYTLDDALAFAPDCALICSPSPFHVKTGIQLAERNIHLFIEKPISNTIADVQTLISMCAQRHLTLMVGYNFRFYPPLQKMRQAVLDGKIGRVLSVRAEIGQYLPDWRPGRSYQESVSAKKSLGGGALLELSHELDYVRWILGDVDRVYARASLISDLEMDVEDMAEIILEFKNGALGSIHLDMVQRAPLRMCRIVGAEGTIEWHGHNHQVRLFTASDHTWQDVHDVVEIDRNGMYEEELQHFLNCVEDGQQPICDGEDGLRALQIVIAAKQSSMQGRSIDL